MAGVQRTKSYLETRFEKGDEPLQSDFSDLIYSMQATLQQGANIVLEPQSDGSVRISTSLPSSLPPSGNAGGDLSETYPNPKIGEGKVKTNHLENSCVTQNKLANGIKLPNPSALTMVINGQEIPYDGTEQKEVVFNSSIQGGVGIPSVTVKSINDTTYFGGKTSTLYPNECKVVNSVLNLRFNTTLSELRSLAEDNWSVALLRLKKRVGKKKGRHWGVIATGGSTLASNVCFPAKPSGHPTTVSDLDPSFDMTAGGFYGGVIPITPIFLRDIVDTDYVGDWYQLPYTAEMLIRRFFYIKERVPGQYTYTIRPFTVFFNHSLTPTGGKNSYVPSQNVTITLCSVGKRRYQQLWGHYGNASPKAWVDEQNSSLGLNGKRKYISEWFAVALVKNVGEGTENEAPRWIIGPFTPFQAIMRELKPSVVAARPASVYQYVFKLGGQSKTVTDIGGIYSGRTW